MVLITQSLAKSLEEKYSKKVQFKDFDIIELIGKGSFDKVHKGQRKDIGEILALKAMKK